MASDSYTADELVAQIEERGLYELVATAAAQGKIKGLRENFLAVLRQCGPKTPQQNFIPFEGSFGDVVASGAKVIDWGCVPEAHGIPPGWKLVPEEPTEAMCRAGEECDGGSTAKPWIDGEYTPENVEKIYKAMLKQVPGGANG